jgi:hypothetical protein
METINNLTDYQKNYFDFIIKEHKRRKKTEATISQQITLVDWITKSYEIDGTMISVFTGKVIKGDKKYGVMCMEDMGMLENILDW